MNIKTKSSLIFFVCLLLLPTLSYFIDPSEEKHFTLEENPNKAGYWDTTPIVIIGDGDWSGYSAQPWFSGSGSWGDPYVIENVTINGQNSSSCIRIRNTNAYYEIRNCTLYNASTTINDAGISLWNANNGYVVGNNCSYNNYEGIWIYQAQNITVENNYLEYNRMVGSQVRDCTNIRFLGNNISHSIVSDGIHFRNSNNVNVTNNKFTSNTQSGIEFVVTCYNIRIQDNEFQGNSDALSLDDANSNYFIDNIINNTIEGIFFWNSDDNIISGNKISNCTSRGITLISSSINNLFYENYLSDNNVNAEDGGVGNDWNTTVIGNYWDDYTDVDVDDDGIGDSPHGISGTAGSEDHFPIWDDGPEPIYIDGAATGVNAHNWTWAVSQSWCSGLGTLAAPYVIEGISRDGRGDGFCVSVQNSDVYFEVRNCDLYNAGFTWPDSAILLNNVANATIMGNDLSDTNYVGVNMDNCHHNNIVGNNVSHTDLGILITNSNFNFFSDNTVNECIENGINIDDDSNDNTIFRNTVINCNSIGISIFSDSDSNNVSMNTVKENNVGISMLDHCDGNRIFSNLVQDNYIGISIHNFNSTNNIIYNNTCINTVNGEDDSYDVNYWNLGTLGNYWNDYGGVDANDDGIGDSVYIVSGLRGRFDAFPIWDDGDDIDPTITLNSPSPGSTFGSNAPSFNLDIYDANLNQSWYIINITGVKYFFTPINGENVVNIDETAWDALPEGDMMISFFVNDTSGHSHFLQVTINKDLPPGTTPPAIPIGESFLFYIVMGVIATVIVTKKKVKKNSI